MDRSLSLFLFSFLTLFVEMRGGRGECPTSNRCGVQGPLIQFPFRLKSQPHHCGYPGFVLSCTENNQIMLELPDSVKLLVKNIIYESREIIVQNPDNCLERQLRNLSLASSPFQFKFEGDVTFFNCSLLKTAESFAAHFIPCLSIPGNPVYAVDSFYPLQNMDLSSCRRLYNASVGYHVFTDYKFNGSAFSLKWPKSICGSCLRGHICRLKKSNSKEPETECIKVKILNNSQGNGEEFINEVATMGTIHHVNIVRLVGFCADGFKRALIYEYLPNESLEKFIFSRDVKNYSLNWKKLQEIAIGIAKGIEYLHQGCDKRILHFDIKPHNILLDHNFNPKVSDFGLAKLCSKEQSAVSMTVARGTIGYIAPEVLSRIFGNVSYKSDVYSFGMLLLEMVGGRKNIDVSVESTSQVYFPEWIYNHLDIGEELYIRIEEKGDVEIAKKLAIVGLSCIQWFPMDRPSMKIVVQMLEGGGKLTMPPNPFASTTPTKTNLSKPGSVFQQELAIISEIE
ncbi:hypothetical protein VitviT2T_025312 [Vitis vinifera]|uniref:Protein kinase domain-containing protein n=2 Tax=Vitis vinifera TaxID=29760 RepID=A0ABY9DKE7_VITVI|nr:hypothetical protein VitviT2T_025312 [Vitis vinifera]